MPRFFPPTLPPNVADYIIDIVALTSPDEDRRRALCNCALICRSWGRRSRYHLIREMFITDRVGLQLAACLAQRKHHGSLHFPIVRRLHLREPSTGTEYAHYTHTAPLLLAPMAKTIETLQITNACWNRKALHSSFFDISACFTALKHLELFRCHFFELRDMRRLVMSLSSLTHLSLSGIVFDRIPDEKRVSRYPGGPHLVCVNITQVGSQNIIGPLLLWLASTRSQNSLRHLSLVADQSHVSDADAMQTDEQSDLDSMDVEDLMCQMSLGMSYPTKLFPIVMPQLESLNLRVQRHELNSFDLSYLKNLRLLRICPVPDNQSRTFENVPDQVAQILAQLANSRLRTLQLYIGQNGWLLLPSRARQWQAMDSLLSSGACRELETVEILYNGPIDGARHTICEPMLYLPYAHARGILLSLRQDHSTPDG